MTPAHPAPAVADPRRVAVDEMVVWRGSIPGFVGLLLVQGQMAEHMSKNRGKED